MMMVCTNGKNNLIKKYYKSYILFINYNILYIYLIIYSTFIIKLKIFLNIINKHSYKYDKIKKLR